VGNSDFRMSPYNKVNIAKNILQTKEYFFVTLYIKSKIKNDKAKNLLQKQKIEF